MQMCSTLDKSDCDCDCECINRHTLSVISFAHTPTHTEGCGTHWRRVAASCKRQCQSCPTRRLGNTSQRSASSRTRLLTTSDVRRLPFVNIGVVVVVVGVVVVSIGIGIDVDVVYLSSSVAAMLQVQGNFGRRATDGGRRMRRQK